MHIGGLAAPKGNTTHSGQNWWPHSPQMWWAIVMGCFTHENDTARPPGAPDHLRIGRSVRRLEPSPTAGPPDGRPGVRRGRMCAVTAVPNVLAARYASPEMVEVWSATNKVVLERRLWIAVMRAQRELGIDVPEEAIEAYEKVVDRVDLDSIEARERVTRHDVKARLEEFSALAGHEHAHKGMTSRDLTENVEQMQVRRSLELLRTRAVASVLRLARIAAEHAETVMVGRSHNVAAQATTLGKRLANYGEELLVALERLDSLLERYPLRGLKGPVGTQQDQLDLLGGDLGRLEELERRVAEHLG